jgi:heptosyltransferase-3
MRPKAGVFCHNGLGDGVNCLVLSNTLQLNGWQVDTFQNTIGSMQEWFPHLPVHPYPPLSDLPKVLSSYDWFFVVHNDTYEFVVKLIQEGKRRFPEQMKVIYLYPSKHIVNEPYYTDCLVEAHLSIAENLRLFSEKILHLPKISKSNGFIPPADLTHRKFPKRIVVHPTSARLTRNWPKEKFVKLALHLRDEGYRLVFIPGGAKEKEEWKDLSDLGFEVPVFPTLDLLARFIYESGYLIGNDSGLGHLASALGVPTLTFCRRKTWANMWAPSFAKGVVVSPSSLIPNIRGFRLRDRHWKKFITVGMARRAFERLVQTSGL